LVLRLIVFYMQPSTNQIKSYERSVTPFRPDSMDPTKCDFPTPTAHYSGGKLTYDFHHTRMHCVRFDINQILPQLVRGANSIKC
jgi:hypothetical protein